MERWPLVNFTAASVRAEGGVANSWRVAGFGVTRAHSGFSALPAVRSELDGIVREQAGDSVGVLPGRIYWDQAFTEQALRESAAAGFPVLHMATHFDLRSGKDSESSLLLGTGEKLSLRQLREGQPRLDLRHVDLVALSACNTAIGGANADGAEIEGVGAIMQRQGAKAVLASLWSVADRSSGDLMKTFYGRRKVRDQEFPVGKAAALRIAQLDLLRGDDAARPCGIERGVGRVFSEAEARPACRYSHPYYWAPFVLMGDGS